MLIVSETDLGTPEDRWLGHPALSHLPRMTAPLADASRLVVVAPHPDDEVLGVAGLLLHAARAGLPVTIVAVTDGEASHPGSAWTGERMATRRRAESASALRHLGLADARVHRCAIGDGTVADHEDQLVEVLGDLLEPGSICVATWRRDGHPDHDATGRAAACAVATSDARLLEHPIWAWHTATPEQGLPLDRAVRLDLAPDQVAIKARAVAAFRSQIHPVGPETADRPVLPPEVRARFERAFETFFLTDEDA